MAVGVAAGGPALVPHATAASPSTPPADGASGAGASTKMIPYAEGIKKLDAATATLKTRVQLKDAQGRPVGKPILGSRKVDSTRSSGILCYPGLCHPMPAPGCAGITMWIYQNTTLGSLHWKYSVHEDFCWSGVTYHGTPTWSDSFSGDGTAYFLGYSSGPYHYWYTWKLGHGYSGRANKSDIKVEYRAPDGHPYGIHYGGIHVYTHGDGTALYAWGIS